jgi:hypothetical protein
MHVLRPPLNLCGSWEKTTREGFDAKAVMQVCLEGKRSINIDRDTYPSVFPLRTTALGTWVPESSQLPQGHARTTLLPILRQ